MTCPRCDAPTSAIYDVPSAVDPAQFEDHARQLYPDCARRAVPAWIVGAEDNALPGARHGGLAGTRPDQARPAGAVQCADRADQRRALPQTTQQSRGAAPQGCG